MPSGSCFFRCSTLRISTRGFSPRQELCVPLPLLLRVQPQISQARTETSAPASHVRAERAAPRPTLLWQRLPCRLRFRPAAWHRELLLHLLGSVGSDDLILELDFSSSPLLSPLSRSRSRFAISLASTWLEASSQLRRDKTCLPNSADAAAAANASDVLSSSRSASARLFSSASFSAAARADTSASLSAAESLSLAALSAAAVSASNAALTAEAALRPLGDALQLRNSVVPLSVLTLLCCLFLEFSQERHVPPW